MDNERWGQEVKNTFNQSNQKKGISLYIHLPFCERLCTYCGCNKRITKNHRVEEPYMDSLVHEWKQYLALFGEKPKIRELHLGGGTPTFFQPNNLERLIRQLFRDSELHAKHDFGFEGSPNNTTTDHLKSLYDLGFRRLSLGVQDFDQRVQKAVNRIHSYDKVKLVIEAAREIGYDSINLDLIYGLPFQTNQSIKRTLNLVGRLAPDRIAFYSYAHVPWKSPSQRGYAESDLPADEKKHQLFREGENILNDLGYVNIGMDHFALETDSISKAYRKGTLHRNFMGYTVSQTDLLIGLGVSAISDTKTAYAQNEKQVESYQRLIADETLAVYRGHFLADSDQHVRNTILQLICTNRAGVEAQYIDKMPEPSKVLLKTLQDDGLVELTGSEIKVTPKGKPFIRNICSVFDAHLWKQDGAGSPLFSKAI